LLAKQDEAWYAKLRAAVTAAGGTVDDGDPEVGGGMVAGGFSQAVVDGRQLQSGDATLAPGEELPVKVRRAVNLRPLPSIARHL
jgi:hypothetical protein